MPTLFDPCCIVEAGRWTDNRPRNHTNRRCGGGRMSRRHGGVREKGTGMEGETSVLAGVTCHSNGAETGGQEGREW